MAALVFPPNPTVGQLYPNPAISGIAQWEWNGSEWVVAGSGAGGGGIGDAPADTLYARIAGDWAAQPTISATTPPATPEPGMLWFDSAIGVLFQYYQNAWVEIANATPTGAYLPLAGGNLNGPLTVGGNLTVTGTSNIPGYATTAALGSYLPLAGGTLTGSLNIQKASPGIILAGTEASAKTWALLESGGGFYIQDSTDSTNIVFVYNQGISVTGSITTSGGIIGKTDASNAPAGVVGEYGSAANVWPGTTVSSNVTITVTSLVLAAGDWDIGGSIFVSGGPVSQLAGCINTTAASMSGDITRQVSLNYTSAVLGAGTVIPISTSRWSLGGATTVYVNGNAVFPSGSAGVGGSMWARRMR